MPIFNRLFDTKIDIDKFLPQMESFINSMYYIEQDFQIDPRNRQIGTAINYSDVKEMRPEFLRNLIASVVRYVYSKQKQSELKSEMIKEGTDESDANELISIKAKEKFRPSEIKGQFSELLLFNLLQYHFKAIPILRKMPITTNTSLERNGADAIHIAKENNKYVLYLGEAKTYGETAKPSNRFKPAFKSALTSILDNYNNHRNELQLYSLESFIEPKLEKLTRDYLNGKLKNIEVHLVSIVTYENIDTISGTTRDEFLKSIAASIEKGTKALKSTDYPLIPNELKSRIHYILFPIKNVNSLLDDFKLKLGI